MIKTHHGNNIKLLQKALNMAAFLVSMNDSYCHAFQRREGNKGDKVQLCQILHEKNMKWSQHGCNWELQE